MSAEAKPPPLDLRLALPAVLGWLAVLWGLGRSWPLVLGAALLAGPFAAATARSGRRCYAWAVGCCVVAMLLLPLSVRLRAAHDTPLARLARAHTAVTAELVATDDPRPLAATGTSGAPRSRWTPPSARSCCPVDGHRCRAECWCWGRPTAGGGSCPGSGFCWTVNCSRRCPVIC